MTDPVDDWLSDFVARGRAAQLAVDAAIAGVVTIGSTSCGGTAACAPQVVSIAIVGDSLKRGSEFPASPNRMDKLLQATLDAQLGAGQVHVRQVAFGGATIADLLGGTHGFQAWPTGLDDDLLIVGFGTNEAAHADDLVAFGAAWRTLAMRPGVIFATPYPMDDSRPYDPMVRATNDTYYAQVIRNEAAAGGVPLIDDNLFVLGLPDWRDRLFDGIHPCGDDGYPDHACAAPAAIAAGYLHAQVVRESWAPVLVPLITTLRRACS